MKILMLSNMFPSKQAPYYGTFVRNFYEEMTEEGWDIDKVVITKSNNKVDKIKSYLKFIFEANKKIRKNSYEYIYIHYISMSSLPIIFSNKFTNIIANAHGSDVYPKSISQKIFQFMARYTLKKSSLVIVPSDYFKVFIERKYKIPQNRIIISPSGGVDSKIFYPKDLSDNLNKKKIRLGFVGRIEKVKGWNTYLEAIELLEQSEEFEHYLVGSGSESKELQEWVHENGSRYHVEYSKGMSQPNLADFYRSIDILVFPTTFESLGLVALEAMACGVIVIGSDIQAVREYVLNSYNGYLFTCGSSEDLVRKLNKYLTLSYSEKIKMSNNAANTASEYFKERVAQKLKLDFDKNISRESN